MHTVLLHHSQELDDDLGRRADENLALARLLGVVDGVERIVENGGLDHFGDMRRFSMAEGDQGICVESQPPEARAKRVPSVCNMRGLQLCCKEEQCRARAQIGARQLHLPAI
jgi:hypothetical protein